ncbi:FAD/NAD(P)-binding domain-containing protein [Thozetella sp. PMI_491]|nr:FAD/NAD(P)-binding domain-containing protein [Thozetella sp. PMI_491]
MGAPKRIVILGGSYGGLSIAHNLLKHTLPKLPVEDGYQVIIVSPSSQVICRPAAPRALISDDLFPQEKLFVDIATVFAPYSKQSFQYLQGAATGLDHKQRTVQVAKKDGSTESIDYYALVIATGASTPSPLHSLNRDETYLKQSWADFRKQLKSAHHIVIAGGGPSGIETAGELGEYLNGRAGWFSSKLEAPKVPITVLTAGSRILPILRPSLADKAEKLLGKVGVSVVKNSKVQVVTPAIAGTQDVASKATITLENGKTLEADLYIPAFGTTPNTAFIDKELLASDGRVETNTATLRVEKAGPRVYAIGDASTYARPAVHSLLSAVPILASNIKRDLLLDAKVAVGVPAERTHTEDKRESQLVPIGKSKGVGAMMGYQIPSFLIWLLKGRDYWLWTTSNLWNGKQWAKES